MLEEEKSISEKSQGTAALQEPLLEIKSKQTEFFVREVKDKRMTNNGPEFLIGWRDFPLEKDDTWEPKFDGVGTYDLWVSKVEWIGLRWQEENYGWEEWQHGTLEVTMQEPCRRW